jgi:ribose-phosphate pyrophosphokinase
VHEDGEVEVEVLDSVRGRTCFVVQSLYEPINTNLMELLLLSSKLK